MEKIMIIVPHEDDELNLVGGLLNLKEINKDNCYIVFVTNGEYDLPSIIREKEARKSAKYLGIPDKNLIFLGYPDTSPNSKNHIYHTRKPDIFYSNHNIRQTYLELDDEFHYKVFKKHANYNYDSLLEDLVLIIQKYKPDILITNDFDSHPDHRCLSLTFEKAIGIVLKKVSHYSPKIFKAFAYPTAYRGIADFSQINIESTKFNTELYSLNEMQNPYYKWVDRVRFPTGKDVRRKFVLANRLYKNLNKHVSQRTLLESYNKIINSDQVFWERRTDNIALHSKITASSGEVAYINDFLYFDCKNILNCKAQKAELINAAWMPKKNDKEKTIRFEFATVQCINVIKLYQNFNSKGIIKNIRVKMNQYTDDFILNDLVSEIVINACNTDFLEIKILDDLTGNEGFSEIELYEPKSSNIIFMQLLNDDNFVYDKYYFDKLNIKMYAYDGIISSYIEPKDLIFYLNNLEISYEDLILVNRKKIDIKVILKNDRNKCIEATFLKITKMTRLINHIMNVSNSFIVNINIFLNRIRNKIHKFLVKYLFLRKKKNN